MTYGYGTHVVARCAFLGAPSYPIAYPIGDMDGRGSAVLGRSAAGHAWGVPCPYPTWDRRGISTGKYASYPDEDIADGHGG